MEYTPLVAYLGSDEMPRPVSQVRNVQRTVTILRELVDIDGLCLESRARRDVSTELGLVHETVGKYFRALKALGIIEESLREERYALRDQQPMQNVRYIKLVMPDAVILRSGGFYKLGKEL